MLARSGEDPQPRAISAAGVEVTVVEGPPQVLARELLDRAAGATLVWVGSPDGDPGLTDALAAEATRRGGAGTPEVEVLVGSWDQPGSRLLDVVTVMDRLRSPGGCPWDAEQTHQSLVPYLLEEAHEAVEAIESGDDDHILEELGDVLLQVVFHARVAAEREDGFDIDDVSARLVDKLVHRHPHVFGDVDATDAAAVEANWEQLKAAEKPHRAHPLEGIPAGMPELARAAKVASRLERAGRGRWLAQRVEKLRATGPRVPTAGTVDGDPIGRDPIDGEVIAGEVVDREIAGEGVDREAIDGDAVGGDVVATGAALMAQVLAARRAGTDPAAALRALLRQLEDELAGP